MAKLIVLSLLLFIRKNLVSLLDLNKLFTRRRVLVRVRMVLLCKLIKGHKMSRVREMEPRIA